MVKNLAKALEQIGLNENESRVYLASLELGTSTAQHIAAKATVSRPNTYIMIESLIKKGLMSSVTKGKKRYFVAAPPKDLKHLFDRELQEISEKRDVLDKLLPDLSAITSAASAPKFSLFEGEDGVLTVYKDIIQAAKGTKKLETFVASDMVPGLVPDAFEGVLGDIDRAGIAVRAICLRHSEDGERSSLATHAKDASRKHLRADQFSFDGDLSVAGDKVAAVSLKGRTLAVMIDSKEIADTVRAMFTLAWEAADNHLERRVNRERRANK
jgi:sugar-specific transcriptional regulator TrmB